MECYNGMLGHTFGRVAGCYSFATYCGARLEVFVCLPSQCRREAIRAKTKKKKIKILKKLFREK